eukprot:TRINITY_DN14314_c0_g1_i1.p1 TRINITY_DN14314_c0_g1~~TRINITY_DN14314_c0_g1_i1.p1  ORF type:complete len:168 (+),score=34.50 TRINITY_DN14314_c0_g1_i1:269-772(+)
MYFHLEEYVALASYQLIPDDVKQQFRTAVSTDCLPCSREEVDALKDPGWRPEGQPANYIEKKITALWKGADGATSYSHDKVNDFGGVRLRKDTTVLLLQQYGDLVEVYVFDDSVRNFRGWVPFKSIGKKREVSHPAVNASDIELTTTSGNRPLARSAERSAMSEVMF